MSLDEEHAVIERAKRESEYFGLLFDEYYPPVMAYIVRRTGDMAVAQDICAETFFKGMVRLKSFTWRDVSIGNWFYKIATNEIRQYWRHTKYHPLSIEELAESGYEIRSSLNLERELVAAQEKLERQQLYVVMTSLVPRLGLKYQEVIVLRYQEHKKISEIAAILGKREGTVKSLVSRAVVQLKQMMDSEMQPNTDEGINFSEGLLHKRTGL